MIKSIDFHNMAAQKYYAPPNSWTKEKRQEVFKNRIFSTEWFGSEKKDGAFYKFIKNDDGSMELLGRSRGVSGDYLNKIEWVPHLQDFFQSIPNGSCLLGELYIPARTGSNNTTTVMGCLKEKAIERQKNDEDKLKYYIFDVLAWNGTILYNCEAIKRVNVLRNISEIFNHKFVEWAQYLEGKELYDSLGAILENGGEGIVLIRKNSIYQPDKRPSKDCLKVKKEVANSIDCIVMGALAPAHYYSGKCIEDWKFWEHTLTGAKVQGLLYEDFYLGKPYKPITKAWFYGWAGSLQVGLIKDKKVVAIGSVSGLSEEILQNWRQYKGKVIELTCMEIMKTEGLRHPKFVRFRTDKPITDCTWESVYGEKEDT